MANLTLVQAINLALIQEMERDDRVIVLGEDVGRNGGVFRVTEGLYKRFGAERVVDTPLAESGIVGTSIGLAMASEVSAIPSSRSLPLRAGIDVVHQLHRLQHFGKGCRMFARSAAIDRPSAVSISLTAWPDSVWSSPHGVATVAQSLPSPQSVAMPCSSTSLVQPITVRSNAVPRTPIVPDGVWIK